MFESAVRAKSTDRKELCVQRTFPLTLDLGEAHIEIHMVLAVARGREGSNNTDVTDFKTCHRQACFQTRVAVVAVRVLKNRDERERGLDAVIGRISI